MQSLLERLITHPWTELLLMLLILMSVGVVILEVGTWPGSPLGLRQLDLVLMSLFSVELGIRFGIARRKRRFFQVYWLDLIAILPWGSGLRLLRLLRLLRIGNWLSRRLSYRGPAFTSYVSLQISLATVVVLIVIGGSLTLYQVEQGGGSFRSLSQTFWWSVLTLVASEPIGGEAETPAGRVVTLIMMLSGLTLFAGLTGIISAKMVERLQAAAERGAVDLEELQDHVVICGWNRGGHLVVEELHLDPQLRGRSLVIVAEFTEIPERELNRIDRRQIQFYTGDYTTIDVLETIGIDRAAQAILLADATRPRSDQDRDARTVLAALTIEKLNPQIHTCAQLLDRKNDVQLRVAGVEDVVVGDELTSHLIATSARNQGLTDVLTEILTLQVGNQFYKIPLPAGWAGIPFAEASQRVKQLHDGILLALERYQSGQRHSLVNPAADTRLEPQDQLILIAPRSPQRDLR